MADAPSLRLRQALKWEDGQVPKFGAPTLDLHGTHKLAGKSMWATRRVPRVATEGFKALGLGLQLRQPRPARHEVALPAVEVVGVLRQGLPGGFAC